MSRITAKRKMTRRVSEFKVFLSAKPLMDLWKNNKDLNIIAKELGINVLTARKYMNDEVTIHYERADQYAIKLGLHPFNIWGDEWIEPSLPSLKRGTIKKG